VLASATVRAQLVKFLNSIDGSTAPIDPPAPGVLTPVNNFNYKSSAEAPLGIVAAYGTSLASQVVSSDSLNLTSALGGTTVAVTDSAGVLRLAPLYFVSPGQLDFVVNQGTATGPASVTVTSPSGDTSVGTMTIAAVAPGIASSNPVGTGVAFATAIRLAADGVTQTPVTVIQCGNSGCTPTPIDVSTGTVFITFYGTGIRGRSSLSNVSCNIGGVNAMVVYAGDQVQFPGLDQVNVQIPASLQGAGQVTVVFTIDGQTTNPVTISVM
jgi:uncharacterized protein (TIGR03437 family)